MYQIGFTLYNSKNSNSKFQVIKTEYRFAQKHFCGICCFSQCNSLQLRKDVIGKKLKASNKNVAKNKILPNIFETNAWERDIIACMHANKNVALFF